MYSRRSREEMADKRIDEVFGEEFLGSNLAALADDVRLPGGHSALDSTEIGQLLTEYGLLSASLPRD
jgi:hypothetical protein